MKIRTGRRVWVQVGARARGECTDANLLGEGSGAEDIEGERLRIALVKLFHGLLERVVW